MAQAPRPPLDPTKFSPTGMLSTLIAWAILLTVCGLPLATLVWAVTQHPAQWSDAWPRGFRLEVLGRTLLYNAIAGLLAVILGLPVGIVLGRSRGWVARILWVVVPLALLMPTMAFTYGWSQAIRLAAPALDHLGLTISPGGTLDIARCIWTLAAYLWAIPACAIGLTLRRADVAIELQAVLDGGLTRITLRQLSATLLASFAATTLLATQEFAVYEPTGISVVATEVRMVFESGAFSPAANAPPPANALSPGSATPAGGQAARTAAAITTAIPLLIVTAALALLIGRLARSQADVFDSPTVADRPPALEPSPLLKAAAIALVLLNVAIPIAALCASLRTAISPTEVWETFSPAIRGTLLLGALTGTIALALSALLTVRRPTTTMHVLALTTFLIGGQFIAIALIRLTNRDWLSAVYDSAALPVAADLARFAFLPLAAAASTFARPWRGLRDLAAVDGAGPFTTARYVVLPLAWPTLAAAALLLAALSMTEVPATVLLSPQTPQLLVPLLITWVHMLRYDPMIQASLLMITLVAVPALIATVLIRAARRLSLAPESRDKTN